MEGASLSIAVAVTLWAVLSATFWAADAIAQFKADLMRERNTKK